MKPDLVGRHAELGVLVGLLGRESGAAVVRGPSGVGKSRLAQEAAGVLSETAEVVEVFANDAARSVPFGAFAHLVPPPSFGPPDPTAMLQAAAVTLLDRVGDGAGMIAVDDAHLLDERSVALVVHLVHNSPVSVLLTIRSGVAVPDDIARLWTSDSATVVELGHLDEEDTLSMVAALCGGVVDAPTAHEIWTATQGNPLFIRELVLAAIDDGQLVVDEGLHRLTGELRPPERLTELVRAQLEAKHREDVRTLELLAVTGPVDLETFANSVGADTVERLESDGALTVNRTGDHGGTDLVRLSHPLYEEALAEEMSTTRRRNLQRTGADMLSGSKSSALRFREAMLRIDCGLRVDAGTIDDAAQYALACFDTDAAERLVRSAVQGEADHATRVALDRVLAKLLRWTGRHDEAEQILARTDIESVEDSHTRAKHVIDRSENLFRGLLDADAAHRLLDDARAVDLADADDQRLAAFDASLILLEGRASAAAVAAQDVIDSGTDPAATAMAAIVRSYAHGRTGAFDSAVSAADLAEALADAHEGVLDDDPTAPWSARCLALCDSGELDRAHEELDAGPRGADALDRVHWQAWRELIAARVASVRGATSSAVLHARSAALGFRDHEDRALERVAWAGVVRTDAQRGVVAAEALRHAREIDPGPFRLLDCEIDWAEAWSRAAGGALGQAVDELLEAARSAAEDGQTSMSLQIAHDALRVDGSSVDAAKSVLDWCDGVDGSLASARRTHAQAALDRDLEAMAGAADEFSAVGALLVAAEVAAQASALANDSGDARRAKALAASAIAWRAECEDARTPALALLAEPISLTRREREVATLAANGLTGPQIAEQLFLSVRTVNNHLQRSYQKLGIDSRSGLADALSNTARLESRRR